MQTVVSSTQSITSAIERHNLIINRLITAALVCVVILVAMALMFCEFLNNKPIGILGQWLRVRLFLFSGTAFLFAFYCPISVMVGLIVSAVEIVRLWGSYSVTMVFLQGFSAVIIAMMNQLQVATLSGTPIGSS